MSDPLDRKLNGLDNIKKNLILYTKLRKRAADAGLTVEALYAKVEKRSLVTGVSVEDTIRNAPPIEAPPEQPFGVIDKEKLLSRRQAIISDKEVRRVFDDLFDIPERLRVAQSEFEKAENALATFEGAPDAEATIERLESEAFFIAKEGIEVDGAGDPVLDTKKKPRKKYTNDDQRKAAAKAMYMAEPSYARAIEFVNRAKAQKAALRFEVAKGTATIKWLVNVMNGNKAAAGLIEGLGREEIHRPEMMAWARVRDFIQNFK